MFNVSQSVVSTIISGVLFARFRIVNHFVERVAFYLWHHEWSKKVPVEKESSLSMGGTIFFKRKVWIFYIYYVETGTFLNSKWQGKIRLKISFEKWMCWRQGHNVLERKLSKSGFSSFISFCKCFDVTKKGWYGRNMVDYTKTSKKNARYFSWDYSA